MYCITKQPIHLWKFFFLFLDEAIKHRQHCICFKGGFAFNDRHFFYNSIFHCSNAYQGFIISSPGKGVEMFYFLCAVVFCCFLFVCFFPSSAELGNGCRLKFNQECYQTIEVFLEISRFMYILQMLFNVIYKKRHSIANTLLSFVTDLPRVLQLPL